VLDLRFASHELRWQAEMIDCDSRTRQKQILERLAFDCFIRKGYVPPELIALQKIIASVRSEFKFNPYHDELGRFTFAPDGEAEDSNDDDNNSSGGNTNETSNQGGASIRLVQEEIPPSLPLKDEIPVAPKPLFPDGRVEPKIIVGGEIA
jgi:hypothetical protein